MGLYTKHIGFSSWLKPFAIENLDGKIAIGINSDGSSQAFSSFNAALLVQSNKWSGTNALAIFRNTSTTGYSGLFDSPNGSAAQGVRIQSTGSGLEIAANTDGDATPVASIKAQGPVFITSTAGSTTNGYLVVTQIYIKDKNNPANSILIENINGQLYVGSTPIGSTSVTTTPTTPSN